MDFTHEIFGEVFQKVDIITFPIIGMHIDYIPGRSSQIIKKLVDIQESPNMAVKGSKYPLVAFFLDLPEVVGSTLYAKRVTIPKISIANFTDITWDVSTKDAKNFKPILQPIYETFIKQLAWHKNIVGVDFPHVAIKRYGNSPKDPKAPSNFNDFLDSIDILNLDITFKEVIYCNSILSNS